MELNSDQGSGCCSSDGAPQLQNLMVGGPRSGVEALRLPSVEEACQYLHTHAINDDEGEPFVRESYTLLANRWPLCQPRALVQEMNRLEYTVSRSVGRGPQTCCRLYLLVRPDLGLPRQSFAWVTSQTRPSNRSMAHGKRAICVTDLEYRLFRLMERDTNPQPTRTWDAHALDLSETYSVGTLVERLQTNASLVKEVLMRFVVAGIVSCRRDSGIYKLAINPQNVVLRRVSRPIYLVSQETFDRIERAMMLAYEMADSDGMLLKVSAYVQKLAEEWKQTTYGVRNRLTTNSKRARAARTPYQQMVYEPLGFLPLPRALSWSDLLVSDTQHGFRSVKLMSHDRGYVGALERVKEQYEAVFMK